jgi:RNA polymerase sigma factor (sigma-70 family)
MGYDLDTMTDAELLRAWHGGDRAAGETLFERHYDGVSRFFRNKVPEPADLVQRTFLACLEQVERFRGEASFRTFLFAIANNLLRKHYRALAGPRGKVELGTVSAEDLRQSPSRELVVGEEKRLLLRALRRLPVDQQVLLELHYWEQLKVGELAGVLGVPEGTVKTRMRAARLRLEGLIEELAGSPSLGRSTVTRLDEWAEGLRERLVAPRG